MPVHLQLILFTQLLRPYAPIALRYMQSLFDKCWMKIKRWTSLYNKCSKQYNVIDASSTVGVVQSKVDLEPDRPSVRVQVYSWAEMLLQPRWESSEIQLDQTS